MKETLKQLKGTWFYYGLIAGLIPIITRLCARMGTSEHIAFDFKAVVFLSLALVIGNFNLLGTRDFTETEFKETKRHIINISYFFTFIIAVALILFFINEANVISDRHDYDREFIELMLLALKIASGIFVIASVWMSGWANMLVLKQLEVEKNNPKKNK